MKIIYFSHTFFSDCDFPLIQELEKKGHEVISYYHLAPYETHAGLVEINTHPATDGIIPASKFNDMQIYKNFVNLDNVFFINNPHCRRFHISRYSLWMKLYLHIKRQKAEMLQLTYPLNGWEKILYSLNMPKILTVHDPFMHSGRYTDKAEKDRIEAFRKSDRLILLNEVQKNDFMSHYDIATFKIAISHLGEYCHINYVEDQGDLFTSKPFVLFFGLISEYKGIDILMESMICVHRQFPDIDLVVIGRGKLYFDYSKYVDLDYIKFINRFATVQELSNLLRRCLFVVCPYKDATQSGVVQTAFSAEAPVVATNVGNFSKVISNGLTGLIVPPNDVKALSDAICSLLSDRKKLNDLRNNIGKIWRPMMSWEKIANDYLRVYSEVLKANGTM